LQHSNSKPALSFLDASGSAPRATHSITTSELRDRDRGDDVPSSFCKKTFKQNRYFPESLKPKALITHSKDGCERMPVMNAGRRRASKWRQAVENTN
jgi:hypothetical protein